MVKTRQWVLAKKPTDLPVLDGPDATFKLQDAETEEVKDGQILVKSLYYSNDPAQRGWINKTRDPKRLYVPPVADGSPMRAYAIAEVLESKSPNFKVGDHVRGPAGWVEHAVLDAAACTPATPLPNGLSETHHLGALGFTGMTAYYGTKVVARTTAEDVVVVSGAAGATGSMVVQIAKKLIGAKKVIGIAGTDAKCRWVESLGADVCLNYKSSSFKDDLVAATPDFADVYFDNVGGEILDLMFSRMAKFGRIAACGAISNYNNSADKTIGLKNWFEVISMRIEVKGFIVLDYLSHFQEVTEIFQQAIKDGKLKIGEEAEDVMPTKFEDVPKTWLKLFEGANQGKLITKLT
jgi:NADPH-dependent curcumin reductase CurA